MTKLTDFIKNCKTPIIWTAAYVFMLWAVMHILFNFEIFSAQQWIRVSHARLHGIAGLTFGILVYASIPLYIATTAIVIRTKKPLLALPVPKFIANTLAKMFPKYAVEDKSDSQTSQQNESVAPEQPDDDLKNIPAEMRGAFLRARAHPNRINTPICSVCSTTPNIYPNNEPTPTSPDFGDTMPLPPDFDNDDDFNLPSKSGAPIFHDIDFYDTQNESANTNTTSQISNNPVIAHLQKTNRSFTELDNDIIVTSDSVIAVHNDSDFWIMDDPMWFASGQTRVSPIQALLETAQKNNVAAVLFLGSTNIMDFDKKRDEWQNAGIRVITDISEL